MVTFEYTDGQHTPGRTITMAAAKVHEIASTRAVHVTDGWDEYKEFCKAHGHEPAATGAGSPEPESEAEVPTDDGLPEGYTVSRRGSWRTLTGPDGSEVGKSQNDSEIAEMASAHQNAESVDTADDG